MEPEKNSKEIGSRLDDPDFLKAAQGSKALERMFTEVADVTVLGAKGIAETQEALGKVGDADWKPGTVKIVSIQILEGDMAFYMANSVAGFDGKQDVRITEGTEIPIEALPIRIRACVLDERKRCSPSRRNNRSTGTITFNETDRYRRRPQVLIHRHPGNNGVDRERAIHVHPRLDRCRQFP